MRISDLKNFECHINCELNKVDSYVILLSFEKNAPLLHFQIVIYYNKFTNKKRKTYNNDI